MVPADYEALGSFYLGKQYDLDAQTLARAPLLYDSRDLTTHAVCVGMTGSGKTGLGVALIEEAAIDGVPVLAIDPKGDLGNLLLTFPQLEPEQFAPWLDPAEADRRGISLDALAEKTALSWRDGLQSWGQDGARIKRFQEAVDAAIYTPGSSAGLPLSVLRSFAAPAPDLLEDREAIAQKISSSVSGILSLVGVDADPLQDPGHVFMSTLIERAWREGKDLALADLIRGLQSPPFDKLGYLDLESVFPAGRRQELALRINSLVASPSFSGWLQGEPLDISRLLYTSSGKPRLSILSLSHLGDAERMFFVTLLLAELLAWTRRQTGTSSLRALLYMDEVFGYFPPSANPPSKPPMLTLLKQARAFGLGIVLATQNPVDLDYKALSNMGTWLLGRLQTQRDKDRLLEGLESAAAGSSGAWDRQAMDRILSSLGQRLFLLHNVHEERPVVFQTRWVLSFLRGPLSVVEIERLMRERRTRQSTADGGETSADAQRGARDVGQGASGPVSGSSLPGEPLPELTAGERPIVPASIAECFLPPAAHAAVSDRIVYRPCLLGLVRAHYVDAKAALDTWQTLTLLADTLPDLASDPWDGVRPVADPRLPMEAEPRPGAVFQSPPGELLRESKYRDWAKKLVRHVYREHSLALWRCLPLKSYSRADETEGDFRVRVREAAHEQRDQEIERVLAKYGPRLQRIEDQIARTAEREEIERAQYEQRKIDTAADFLNALLRSKRILRRGAAGLGTAVRGVGRVTRERRDVQRAEETRARREQQRDALKEELSAAIEAVRRRYLPENLPLERYEVRARKADITVEKIYLAWVAGL